MDKRGERQLNKLHPANLVFMIVLSAFFFVLACWFVPECDEYYFQYWSFESLSDFIHTNPKDTGVLLVGIPANGRYLGNALGILQAKLYAAPGGVYIRAALFAACSAGLLHQLYCYFDRIASEPRGGRKGRRYYGGGLAMCALLLVGAPYGIYSQVMAWGAGFANYVPPVAGMLFLWLTLFSRKREARGPIFLAAFASQLFAEPVTVYFLFFGGALVLDAWIWRNKERLTSALWMTAGFIAGAVVMFSDSGYRQVGGDGRAITAENMIRNLAIIASEVVVNHPIMTPLISVLLVWAAFRSLRSMSERKTQAGQSKAGVSAGAVAGLIAWAVLTAALIPLNKVLLERNLLILRDELFAYEDIHIAIGFTIAAIWVALLALWSAGDCGETVTQTSYLHTVRGRLWFWVGSLVIASGPLLVLYPIKSRHFFISYIILCLVALELYGWIARRGSIIDGPLENWLVRAAAMACCAGLLFVYQANDAVHQQRMDYAEAQIAEGATEVTLPLLPYRAFVTNEGTGKGDISYVCYREEPWDVKFRFVLWKDWEGYGYE